MLQELTGEAVIRDVEASGFEERDLLIVAFEGFYRHVRSSPFCP
jgi:hypothetical protein